MAYGKKSQHYNRTSIETAGKLDLVIMCYEKSIQLLTQAKNHYEKDEIEKKARKMQKALDIVTELQSCLDMEKGGEIARNLDSIYTYIIKRVLQGDLQKNYSIFDECVNILAELKSAWEEIASSEEKEQAAVMENADQIPRLGAQIAA